MASRNGQTAADAANAEKTQPTDYVVLERDVTRDGRTCWVPIGQASTRSKEQAMRQVATEVSDTSQPKDGAYKAVAASNWKGTKQVSVRSVPSVIVTDTDDEPTEPMAVSDEHVAAATT